MKGGKHQRYKQPCSSLCWKFPTSVIIRSIERSPFGHLMKFTQRRFPLY